MIILKQLKQKRVVINNTKKHPSNYLYENYNSAQMKRTVLGVYIALLKVTSPATPIIMQNLTFSFKIKHFTFFKFSAVLSFILMLKI